MVRDFNCNCINILVVNLFCCCSVTQLCPTLRPHGLHHARLYNDTNLSLKNSIKGIFARLILVFTLFFLNIIILTLIFKQLLMVCLYSAYNEKLLCGSNWMFENYSRIYLGTITLQYIIFFSPLPLSV